MFFHRPYAVNPATELMRPIDRPANPLPNTVASPAVSAQRSTTQAVNAPVRHRARTGTVIVHGALIRQRGKLGVALDSYFIGFKQQARQALDQWTRDEIMQPLDCPGIAPIRVNTETGWAALQVQGTGGELLLLELDTRRFPHPTQKFVDFVRTYNPCYPFPQPATPPLPQPQSAVAHVGGRSTVSTLSALTTRHGPVTRPPVIRTTRWCRHPDSGKLVEARGEVHGKFFHAVITRRDGTVMTMRLPELRLSKPPGDGHKAYGIGRLRGGMPAQDDGQDMAFFWRDAVTSSHPLYVTVAMQDTALTQAEADGVTDAPALIDSLTQALQRSPASPCRFVHDGNQYTAIISGWQPGKPVGRLDVSTADGWRVLRFEYRQHYDVPALPDHLFERLGRQRGAKGVMIERDDIALCWESSPNGTVLFLEHAVLDAWLHNQPALERDNLRNALHGAVTELLRGQGETLGPMLSTQAGEQPHTHAVRLHGWQDRLLHCAAQADGRVTDLHMEDDTHKAVRQRRQARARFDAVLNKLEALKQDARNARERPYLLRPPSADPVPRFEDHETFTTPLGYEASWNEALGEPEMAPDPWRITGEETQEHVHARDPYRTPENDTHVASSVLDAIRQYSPWSGVNTQQFNTLTRKLHHKEGSFGLHKYPSYVQIFEAMLADPHLIVYRGELRHEIECRGVLEGESVYFRLKEENRNGNISIYGLMLSGLEQYYLSDALGTVLEEDVDLAGLCSELHWPHGIQRLVRLAVNPGQGLPVPGGDATVERFRSTIGTRTIDLCARVSGHKILAVTPFVADAEELQVALTQQADKVKSRQTLQKADNEKTPQPVYVAASNAAIHVPGTAQGIEVEPEQLLRDLCRHLLGHGNYACLLDTAPLQWRGEEQSLAFGLGVWRVERAIVNLPLSEALKPYVELQDNGNGVLYLVAEISGRRDIRRYGGEIEQVWLCDRKGADRIFEEQCELDDAELDRAVMQQVVVPQLRRMHLFDPLYRIARLLDQGSLEDARHVDKAMSDGRTEDTAIRIGDDDAMDVDRHNETIIGDENDDAMSIEGSHAPSAEGQSGDLMEVDSDHNDRVADHEYDEYNADDGEDPMEADARVVIDFLLHVTRDEHHTGGSQDAPEFTCRFDRPYDSLPAAVQGWVERASDGTTLVRLQRGSFTQDGRAYPSYMVTTPPQLHPATPGTHVLDQQIDLAIDHPRAHSEERTAHQVLTALAVHVLGHEDYSRFLEQTPVTLLDNDPLTTRGWKIGAWRIPCDAATLPASLQRYAERSGNNGGVLHLVAQLCQPQGGRSLVMGLWLCSRSTAEARMADMGRFYREELAGEAANKLGQLSTNASPALPTGFVRDGRFQDLPHLSSCGIHGYVLGLDRLTDEGRSALTAYIGPGDNGRLGIAFAAEPGDDTLWFCQPAQLARTVAGMAEHRTYRTVFTAMTGNRDGLHAISGMTARTLDKQPDLQQLTRQISAAACWQGSVAELLPCLTHPLLEVPSEALTPDVRRYRYDFLDVHVDLCVTIAQGHITQAAVMRDSPATQIKPSPTCAWRLLGEGAPAGMQAARDMLDELATRLSGSADWSNLLTGTPKRLDQRMTLYRFVSEVQFATLPAALQAFAEAQPDGTAGVRLITEEADGQLHQLAMCGRGMDAHAAHCALLARSLADKPTDMAAADTVLAELDSSRPALRQALEEAATLAGMDGARTLLGNILGTQAPMERQAFEFAFVLPVASEALSPQHRPWFSVRNGQLQVVLYFVPAGEDTSGGYHLANVAHADNVSWQVAQVMRDGEEEAQGAETHLRKFRQHIARLVSNKAPLDKADTSLKRELTKLKKEQTELKEREEETAALLGTLLADLDTIDGRLAAWESRPAIADEQDSTPSSPQMDVDNEGDTRAKRVRFDEQATVRTFTVEQGTPESGSARDDSEEEDTATPPAANDRSTPLRDAELAGNAWQHSDDDARLLKRADRLADEHVSVDDNGYVHETLQQDLDQMLQTQQRIADQLMEVHAALDADFVERLLLQTKRALVESLLPSHRGAGLRWRLDKLSPEGVAQRLRTLIEQRGVTLAPFQLARLRDWTDDVLTRARAKAERRAQPSDTPGRIPMNPAQIMLSEAVLALIKKYDQKVGEKLSEKAGKEVGAPIATLAQANGMALGAYLRHLASTTPGKEVNRRVPFLRSYSTGTSDALLMRIPGGRITEARIDNADNRREMGFYAFPKGIRERMRSYDLYRNGGQLKRVAGFTGSFNSFVRDIVRCDEEIPVDALRCPQIALYPSKWDSVKAGRKFHLLGQAKSGEIVDARLSSLDNFRGMALRHPDVGWGLPEIQALLPMLFPDRTPILSRFIENRLRNARKLPLNPDAPDDPEAKAYPDLGRYLAGRDREGRAYYLLALIERGRIMEVALDTPDNRRRMMRYKQAYFVEHIIFRKDAGARTPLRAMVAQFGHARIWQLVRDTIRLENRQIVTHRAGGNSAPWSLPILGRYPLPVQGDGPARCLLALVCNGDIVDVGPETPQILQSFVARAKAMETDRRQRKHMRTLDALADGLRRKARQAEANEMKRAMWRDMSHGGQVKELARAHNRNWRNYVDEITSREPGEQVDGDIWRYPTGTTAWDEATQQDKPVYLLARRIPDSIDDVDARLDTPKNLALMQAFRAQQQRVESAAERDIKSGSISRAVNRCAVRDKMARGFVHRLADRCGESFSAFVARVVGNGKGKRIHDEFDLRRYKTGLTDGKAPICVRAQFEKDQFGNDELVELVREWPDEVNGDPVLDDGLGMLCNFLKVAPAEVEHPDFMRPPPADGPADATEITEAAKDWIDEEGLTLCEFADDFDDNACLNSILQSPHAVTLQAIIDGGDPDDPVAGMRKLLAATVTPGFGVPVDDDEEGDGTPPRMRYLCFLNGPDETTNFIARVDSDNRITEAMLDAGVTAPAALPVQGNIDGDLYDLLAAFDFTAQDASTALPQADGVAGEGQDAMADWMNLELDKADMPEFDMPWTEGNPDVQALLGPSMEGDLDDADDMAEELTKQAPPVLPEQDTAMDMDPQSALAAENSDNDMRALFGSPMDEDIDQQTDAQPAAVELDWNGLMDDVLHLEFDANAPTWNLPLTLDELLGGAVVEDGDAPQNPDQQTRGRDGTSQDDLMLNDPIPFVPLSTTVYADGRTYTPDPDIAPLSMDHRILIRCVGRGGGRYPFPQEKQIDARCPQHAINSVTVDRYDLDDPNGDARHKPVTQAEFDWLVPEAGKTAGAEAIRVMAALDKKGIKTHLVALTNLSEIEHEPFMSEILDATAHRRDWVIPLQGQAGPGEVSGHFPVMHWDRETRRSYLVDSLRSDQPEMSLSVYLAERSRKGDSGCQLIVPDSCADALLQREVLLDTEWTVAGLNAIDALFHTRSHVLGLGRHVIERTAGIDAMPAMGAAELGALLRAAGIDALHAYLAEALGDDAVRMRDYDVAPQQASGSAYDRIAPKATHALAHLPGLNPMFVAIEKRDGCWYVIEADTADAADTSSEADAMDTSEAAPTLEAYVTQRRAERQVEINRLTTTRETESEALEQDLNRLTVIEFQAGLDMVQAANLLQDCNRTLTRAALELMPDDKPETSRDENRDESFAMGDDQALRPHDDAKEKPVEAATESQHRLESEGITDSRAQAEEEQITFPASALESGAAGTAETVETVKTIYDHRNAVTSNGWRLAPSTLYRGARQKEFQRYLLTPWRNCKDKTGNHPYSKARFRGDYHLLTHVMELCSETRRIDDRSLPDGISTYLLRNVWKISFKIYVLHQDKDVFDMRLGEPPKDASGTVVGNHLAKEEILRQMKSVKSGPKNLAMGSGRKAVDYEKEISLFRKGREAEFRKDLFAAWRKGEGNSFKKDWEILVDIDELCTEKKRVDDWGLPPGVDKYRLSEWKETFEVYVCRDGDKLLDIRLGEGDDECSVTNSLKRDEIVSRMVSSGVSRVTFSRTTPANTSSLKITPLKAERLFVKAGRSSSRVSEFSALIQKWAEFRDDNGVLQNAGKAPVRMAFDLAERCPLKGGTPVAGYDHIIEYRFRRGSEENGLPDLWDENFFIYVWEEGGYIQDIRLSEPRPKSTQANNGKSRDKILAAMMGAKPKRHPQRRLKNEEGDADSDSDSDVDWSSE